MTLRCEDNVREDCRAQQTDGRLDERTDVITMRKQRRLALMTDCQTDAEYSIASVRVAGDAHAPPSSKLQLDYRLLLLLLLRGSSLLLSAAGCILLSPVLSYLTLRNTSPASIDFITSSIQPFSLHGRRVVRPNGRVVNRRRLHVESTYRLRHQAQLCISTMNSKGFRPA